MEEPRPAYAVRRLRGDRRDDYLLVRIDPPLTGSGSRPDGPAMDHVILATRHLGDSLFPIQRWPVFVHVIESLVPVEGKDVLHDHEMKVIAWAAIYDSEEAAREKRVPVPG